MSRFHKLSQTIWHCKLCAAEHNLHYVLSVIMWSQDHNLGNRNIFTLKTEHNILELTAHKTNELSSLWGGQKLHNENKLIKPGFATINLISFCLTNISNGITSRMLCAVNQCVYHRMTRH